MLSINIRFHMLHIYSEWLIYCVVFAKFMWDECICQQIFLQLIRDFVYVNRGILIREMSA